MQFYSKNSDINTACATSIDNPFWNYPVQYVYTYGKKNRK